MKKITIEVTEEQHKEILGIIKPKSAKPWRAGLDGRYWYVCDWAWVSTREEKAIPIDDHYYLTGNYYRTEEEAEKALERQKAIGRVTHRIYELNDGWEPDWANGNQKKYDIYLDYECGEFDWGYGCFCERQTLPCIASEEIADQIIAEMKDDLRLIWNL